MIDKFFFSWSSNKNQRLTKSEFDRIWIETGYIFYLYIYPIPVYLSIQYLFIILSIHLNNSITDKIIDKVYTDIFVYILAHIWGPLQCTEN